MSLKTKESYCGEDELYGVLDEIAKRISYDSLDFKNLVFIGILKGGAPVADYLAKSLGLLKQQEFPVAYLDITLYRDDMIDTSHDPYSRRTEIPFSVKGREIILVDDIMFTGRTVRAALTSIVKLGRPALVKLAAVVDRGFRELPIQPDYVGRRIETTREQGVRVRMREEDTHKGIFILESD